MGELYDTLAPIVILPFGIAFVVILKPLFKDFIKRVNQKPGVTPSDKELFEEYKKGYRDAMKDKKEETE